jgi:glycosyltransferase involved in cell wall biosynthesis
MRVGLNLTQFVPGKSGGVQTYAETLVRGLVGLDNQHEYVLFVNYNTVPLFEDLRGTCELVLVDVHIPRRVKWAERFLPGAELRAYGRGLRKLMVGARVDVLHFPLSFMVPFDYPGRTVVTFLDLQHEYYPQFFSASEIAWRERNYRPAAVRATHLVAISDYTAQSLVTKYGVPREKISVVHLAAGDDIRAPIAEGIHAVDLPAQYFCYPAAYWPHKNHGRLLQAVAHLRAQEGFDLPLVLSGMDAADSAPVRQEVARLGLADQVYMLGYLPREKFRLLLRRAQFMIFPSLFEGFGLPVVEAMAVGCPVACSRSTSLPEIVGDDGYLFDPENVDSIAKAIRDLWRDPTLRERLRQRLDPRARRFTNARMAQETAAVYDRVTGSV